LRHLANSFSVQCRFWTSARANRSAFASPLSYRSAPDRCLPKHCQACASGSAFNSSAPKSYPRGWPPIPPRRPPDALSLPLTSRRGNLVSPVKSPHVRAQRPLRARDQILFGRLDQQMKWEPIRQGPGTCQSVQAHVFPSVSRKHCRSTSSGKLG